MEDSETLDTDGTPRPVVLVAEDDDGVREVVAGMLSEADMEVLCARNGQEAVGTVLRDDGRIQAIVLDLMLPVMDGKAALVEIRRQRPQLPVVIMSGLDGREILGPPLAGSVAAVLRKPFRLAELVVAVRGAIAGDPTELPSTKKCGGQR